MKILIINAGSSSLKYQFIDMRIGLVIAKGVCQRIGFQDSTLIHKTHDGRAIEKNVPLEDYTKSFCQVRDILIDKDNGVIKNLSEIDAVGHRVVQGGASFKKSIIINDTVIKKIEELIPLAPLHNKAHVQAIRACREILGHDTPEVAVFDTSFHTTMPPKAYMYPVPYEYYEKYNIRKYGFHGISHRFVSKRCAELMKKDINSIKMITCHLGNGSSITAINKGRAIDTSMGLTPLDGLIMGTRSGSIDPSIVTFLEKNENLSPDDMNKILNQKSGLLGISGVSSDIRDISTSAELGNERAILAQEIFEYQVIKLIGGYTAAMDGVNAIVFTAGIGENHIKYRKNICEHLSYMGLMIDHNLNKKTFGGIESCISKKRSSIQVFVIPTNEEFLIAQDTLNILS